MKKKIAMNENAVGQIYKCTSILPSKHLETVGCVVPDDRNKHHSVAPTLPLHSPHSPLLTDKTTYQHLMETQLSARYINNKKFLYSTKKSTIHNLSNSEVKNLKRTETSESTTLSSNLLCYCERTKNRSSYNHNHKNKQDSTTTKRLVSTRNAATSPHLDVRKLESMTTLAPSSLRANELSSEENSCKNKFKMRNSYNTVLGDEVTFDDFTSYASNLLKTTHSPSPKPQPKDQNDMLSPDLKEVKPYFFSSPKTYTRTNKKQIPKLSRSEQSSPNVTEGSELRFSYHISTNRSTSCLSSAFIDPWFRNSFNDNKAISDNLKTNSPKREFKDKEELWVKRESVERECKMNKYEQFCNTKSFADAKFYSDPSAAIKMNNKCIAEQENQLKSAPTSPQLLLPTNSFNSCDKLEIVSDFKQKTPPRSTSFSPARVKDSYNPFRAGNFHPTNHTSPINKKTYTDYDFLKVSNPNFLSTRHSFSSVPEKKGDEIQLNIRRLSDQIRQKESFSYKNIKILSSFRNESNRNGYEQNMLISSNEANNRRPSSEIAKNSADFSDYLEQFRCSEAKKAATKKEMSYLDQMSNSKTISAKKNLKSSDCLLETTC